MRALADTFADVRDCPRDVHNERSHIGVVRANKMSQRARRRACPHPRLRRGLSRERERRSDADERMMLVSHAEFERRRRRPPPIAKWALSIQRTGIAIGCPRYATRRRCRASDRRDSNRRCFAVFRRRAIPCAHRSTSDASGSDPATGCAAAWRPFANGQSDVGRRRRQRLGRRDATDDRQGRARSDQLHAYVHRSSCASAHVGHRKRCANAPSASPAPYIDA